MYSTKTAMTTSLRDLLELLDDYTIFSYYISDFKVGKLINSPLRSDDRIPSFAVFRSKGGDLLFKDHGSGEAGNALKFLKLYFHRQYRGIRQYEGQPFCLQHQTLFCRLEEFCVR